MIKTESYLNIDSIVIDFLRFSKTELSTYKLSSGVYKHLRHSGGASLVVGLLLVVAYTLAILGAQHELDARVIVTIAGVSVGLYWFFHYCCAFYSKKNYSSYQKKRYIKVKQKLCKYDDMLLILLLERLESKLEIEKDKRKSNPAFFGIVVVLVLPIWQQIVRHYYDANVVEMETTRQIQSLLSLLVISGIIILCVWSFLKVVKVMYYFHYDHVKHWDNCVFLIRVLQNERGFSTSTSNNSKHINIDLCQNTSATLPTPNKQPNNVKKKEKAINFSSNNFAIVFL